MNGRIYDPLLGRFLSADRGVQFPWDLQSFNRYSYVQNNPLRYVDPSGFFVAPPPAASPFVEKAVEVTLETNPALFILLAPLLLTGDTYHPHKEPTPAVKPPDPSKPQQPGPQDPTKPQQPNPNEPPPAEKKLDPNTVKASDGDKVKTTQAPAQETKPDAPKEEPKKDEPKEDSKDAASDKAAGEPKPGSSGGPGAGKPFAQSVKNAAAQQANNTCVFCGVPTTKTPGPTQQNTDHSDPKSRGGNNTLDNAQNTCRDCNQDKKTMTTQEYQDELERRKKAGN
jgi:hypothetical protein